MFGSLLRRAAPVVGLCFAALPSRSIAAWLYPDAKVKETFSISEQAQQNPQVKF